MSSSGGTVYIWGQGRDPPRGGRRAPLRFGWIHVAGRAELDETGFVLPVSEGDEFKSYQWQSSFPGP